MTIRGPAPASGKREKDVPASVFVAGAAPKYRAEPTPMAKHAAPAAIPRTIHRLRIGRILLRAALLFQPRLCLPVHTGSKLTLEYTPAVGRLACSGSVLEHRTHSAFRASP